MTTTSLNGPAEVDESYFGGKRENMSLSKRKELAEAGAGRGAVGKTAVVGIKDRDTNEVRAEVVADTTGETLQGFVREHAEEGATVYTDEHRSYRGLAADFAHEAVNHSVGEYVDGKAHTNGMESFWSMLKRAHKGTFHKISPKHLERYVDEFAGKHNIRNSGTIAQMRDTVARLIGRRLLYRDLIAGERAFLRVRGVGSGSVGAPSPASSGVAPARSRAGSSIGFISSPVG